MGATLTSQTAARGSDGEVSGPHLSAHTQAAPRAELPGSFTWSTRRNADRPPTTRCPARRGQGRSLWGSRHVLSGTVHPPSRLCPWKHASPAPTACLLSVHRTPPGLTSGSPGTVRAIPSVPSSRCGHGFVQSGESWFSRWLTGKKRTEAYLPDDKNKSVSVAGGGSQGRGGCSCGPACASFRRSKCAGGVRVAASDSLRPAVC